MTEPPVIEHDPDEPPRDTSGNTVYWASAFVLAALWAAYFLIGEYDWKSIALGVGTGAIIAIWAIEITGNKVPKWMR